MPSTACGSTPAIASGDAVSPYYDAMLAKVIAWAPTRQAAIDRLNRGLEETDVRGIVTNIPFLSALMTHPKVRANTIDTGFIERELKKLTESSARGRRSRALRRGRRHRRRGAEGRARADSPWQTFGWMPVGRRQRVFSFRQGQGAEHKVTLHYGSGPMTLSIGKRDFVFATSPADDGGFDLTLDGMKSRVTAVIEGHELYLRTRNGRFDLHWVDPFGGETEEQVGEDKIVAPLAGHGGGAAGRGGRDAGEGRGDPHARSHEDGADAARALCGRAEEDQVQGRRYRRRRRRTRRNRAGGVHERSRPHRRSRPARRAAEREDAGQRRRPDRLHRGADRRRAHTVEVGAFVSPKAIPQMVGSDEVLRGVSHHVDCEFPVLVPNEKGYEASQAAGAKVIAVFAAASESFSRANINCSIAESIERFKPVLARAKADGVRVRGYISMRARLSL